MTEALVSRSGIATVCPESEVTGHGRCTLDARVKYSVAQCVIEREHERERAGAADKKNAVLNQVFRRLGITERKRISH